MYSQSYNCLPNKKQSLFSGPLPHNLGLMRNFTNKSYSRIEDSTNNIGVDFKTKPIMNTNDSNNCLNSGTKNIMDFVYSLKHSSSVKFDRSYISSFSVPAESSKLGCKDIITYNTMTTIPLAPCHLVGGFVGSKSQLGRRRKNDFGVKMWDIIRELVDLVGSSPSHFAEKENHHGISSVSKTYCNTQHRDLKEDSGVKVLNDTNFVGMEYVDKNLQNCPKQSYADVAKLPVKECQSVKIITHPIHNQLGGESSKHCNPKSVIEPLSSCKSQSSSRNRIASECSADSEDSFIVFEYYEDENVDKDNSTSDDDISPSHCNFDEELESDNFAVPSRNSSISSFKPPAKKVRFAEGNSMVKVHPMVTWDYAYRMARKGPWEMFARDSERFKTRIMRTEALLKPILEPQHRSVVFRDRFADTVQ